MVTNLNLTDMETGYKVFRADIIKSIPIRSSRFGVEPELTAKLAKVHARIYEVPISYAGRATGKARRSGGRTGSSPSGRSSATPSSTTRRTPIPATRPSCAWPGPSDTTAGCSSSSTPWLGQRVLEVGSGIGNFTRFLTGRDLVVATELNPRYLRILGNTFERHTRVEVMPLDLDGLRSGAARRAAASTRSSA